MSKHVKCQYACSLYSGITMSFFVILSPLHFVSCTAVPDNRPSMQELLNVADESSSDSVIKTLGFSNFDSSTLADRSKLLKAYTNSLGVPFRSIKVTYDDLSTLAFFSFDTQRNRWNYLGIVGPLQHLEQTAINNSSIGVIAIVTYKSSGGSGYSEKKRQLVLINHSGVKTVLETPLSGYIQVNGEEVEYSSRLHWLSSSRNILNITYKLSSTIQGKASMKISYMWDNDSSKYKALKSNKVAIELWLNKAFNNVFSAKD